jgi:ABC-type transport system involved in multi-copper enzyme maturation permease subunit
MTTPPVQPTPQTPPMPQRPAPPSAPGAGPGAWAPADQGGGPGGFDASYSSPIPVKRTHLGHALASEWTKIRSVRSTMWTLGVFILLVVGLGLLIAANTLDSDYANVPYTMPAFFGLMLGQVCLITLGVLVISSEYGTGMIRATFTASPQRHRVLAAKFLVFFLVVFLVSVVSVGLVGAVSATLHDGGSGRPWHGTVVKGPLYVSLLGVLSLAVGSILRHSAGAITAMLGLVLVPAILPAFFYLSHSTREIGDKLTEYNAPNSLAKIFEFDNGNGNGTPQLWLLVAVTAAVVVIAFALLERRDV